MLVPFLRGLIASGSTTLTSVALLIPYADDCECGCRATGSNPLIAGQPRFAGVQNWNITLATNGAVPIGVVPIANGTPGVTREAFTQNGIWPCYLPWQNSPEDNPLSYCGLRCPSTFRTEDQYTSAAIMMGIVGWISYAQLI